MNGFDKGTQKIYSIRCTINKVNGNNKKKVKDAVCSPEVVSVDVWAADQQRKATSTLIHISLLISWTSFYIDTALLSKENRAFQKLSPNWINVKTQFNWENWDNYKKQLHIFINVMQWCDPIQLKTNNFIVSGYLQQQRCLSI